MIEDDLYVIYTLDVDVVHGGPVSTTVFYKEESGKTVREIQVRGNVSGDIPTPSAAKAR